MATTPGSRLGPYEIVARIGAGGMGEVFRARDTRLDRSVAIKVLPAAFATNAALKLRFEREAKAISQLNHPHICTLYDVGDDYLVMELLEGETLAERLSRGALSLADVLKYGAQIADALDRAHRAGIVHRDLKPGNIMLTKAGAKLLDFGLAKTVTQAPNPDGTTVHHEKALTQEGTILGTFQYMAPEQLEAEEADARTDIFALGAVLYEMATGRRAFEGKTKTSLIAAIVGAQPQPLSQVVPLTPPALEHVIQKCLEKDRDERWQSAHDVAEELKWIATVPAEQKVARTEVNRIAIASAIALALACIALTAMWLRARNAPKPRAAFAVLPPKGFSFSGHMLSPDGTMIAFSAMSDKSDGGIWVRAVDQLEPKRLTTRADDFPVAWSPDSKWIAYISDPSDGRQLRKVAVTGGTPEVISARPGSASGIGAWNNDGTILYCRVFGEGLSAIRQNGTDPVAVTRPDPKRRESFHGWPQFLPDGQRFLYVVRTVADEKNEIWAGSLDGKVKKLIMRADSLVGLARSRLYFVRDGAIYAQPFDVDDLKLTGDARRVVERVAFSEPNASAGAFVGTNGALLYIPVMERKTEFGWYDRNGRRTEKLLEDVDLAPRSLSRDGTKLTATRMDHTKGATDIYVIDLVRGIRTKLTSGLSNHGDPIWSPAGDRVFFTSDREGPYNVYVQHEDGTTPAVPVWTSDRDKGVMDVSPAGDMLLVAEYTAKGMNDLWLVPVDAPAKRRPLIATEANEIPAGFSPDGRWVAYMSDRSGRNEVYMQPIGGGRPTQISTRGADTFLWGHDSSELIVRTFANERETIPLSYTAGGVVPGRATPLFTPPAKDHTIVAVTAKGFAIATVPDPSDYLSLLHYDSAPPIPE